MPDAQAVLSGLRDILPALEKTYKDIHAHPELSMEEQRTADLAATHLETHGYQVVRSIGKTGVVGIMKSRKGPTIMLRADMDALAIKEDTGLQYSSTVNGSNGSPARMHACGHDMHVTWLMGVAQLFAQSKSSWSGTLVVLFQPGEETAQGARAMIDDSLFDRIPKPDIVLGQHVMVGPAGSVSGCSGPITFAADSLRITLFGRGAHGSMPQASIDPIVMAASVILRLQTIVSRELSPTETAVVTIGSVQAGSKDNVIPDEAVIKMNIRTIDSGVRKRILSAIERIVKAEAQGSNAPREPEITGIDSYPLNVNDREASEKIRDAMNAHFGNDRVKHTGPNPASEDFGCFGTDLGVPSVYWFVHGTDADQYRQATKEGTVNSLPVNHSPQFAPVIHPTLEMGVEAMVCAALVWLGT